MIIVFLIQLKYFISQKMNHNISENKKSLTKFNVLVLGYILFCVGLEFSCFFIRSGFAPLILIENDHFRPITQFVEHFRYTLYSVTDFFVGIALLYLFYHQSKR
jgi:hypothetical protein